jgi:hypothetical protein
MKEGQVIDMKTEYYKKIYFVSLWKRESEKDFLILR